MVIFTLGYNHFLNNYNSDCTQDRNKTQTILKRKKNQIVLCQQNGNIYTLIKNGSLKMP